MATQLASHFEGDVLVVEISGELDAASAADAQATITPLIANSRGFVVLDLKGLEFMSSAGIRLIIALSREANRKSGSLRLAQLQPQINDVVSMSLQKMVQVFGSLAGAVHSFGGRASAPVLSVGRSKSATWTNALLDKMRQVGDVEADSAIKALFENGKLNSVNALMRQLVSNDFVPPAELPREIQEYLSRTTDLPTWADERRIARGQSYFGRYSVQMVTVLFCGSLPTTYAARKGVHVLAMTDRLNKVPHRRIVETSQLLLDVMAPGGLQSGGKGLRSAQKVRLMHAAVRYLLLQGGQWELEKYDYPINQEDMAGTLMAFSYAIIAGLPMLGINMTDEQQEDYHHMWKVAGAVMGVVPELLPDSVAEAKILSELIFGRQISDTPEDNVEGREMTANLIRMFKELVPVTGFDEIGKALIRHLVGDRISDVLGVENTPWQRVLRPMQWANGLMQQSIGIPVIAKASEILFRTLFNNLMLMNLGGNRTPFTIPDTLTKDWEQVIDSSLPE